MSGAGVGRGTRREKEAGRGVGEGPHGLNTGGNVQKEQR